MNQEQFKEASRIFNLAVALPEAERVHLVERECSGDAQLESYVRRLLAHEEPATADFLAAQGRPDAPEGAGVTDVRSGTMIGPYKILQQIGEGGFGAVYLAEQRVPVERKVALKIIKLGMDTKQVVGRFEAERQALALMDHPNIARVLDAGATETGRPYFVMELVRGIPITQYCDLHNLSMRQRLRLFIDICHAVQHAHQKGIIHRDIKPTNVLVGEVDTRPVLKVIDFGIAKAMNQRLTERTVFTEFRQFVGTPEYMSPEQAEPMGIDVDTRSDIYSLGVLLYELLVGMTPFDPKRLREAALGEIQRILCEEEPERPSTRLSSFMHAHQVKRSTDLMDDESAGHDRPGSSIELIARHRQTDPHSLSRQLRGDLDWIVMKTLEKDRTRRYESAAILAMDIERYLNHEPVLASPPSVLYRARKLVRRHRGAFAAAAIILLALLGGVIGTSWGLQIAIRANRQLDLALTRESEQRSRAEENADRADAEAAEATRQAAIADAVNEFLNQDLLASVAPSFEEGRGREVPMRDVLDVAARRIERAAEPGGRFADQPLVEAAVRATLGKTYNQLGEFEEARKHLRRARALREQHLGRNDERTLEVLTELAWARLQGGAVDEAVALLEDGVARLKEHFGETHPSTLNAMSDLALAYLEQADLEAALSSARASFTGLQSTLGDEDESTLTAAHNLAIVLNAQGKFAEAQPLFEQVAVGRTRLRGELDPESDNARLALAANLQDLGRWSEAAAEYERIVTLRRELYGEAHPETILALNNLSGALNDQGETERAIHVLEQVFQASRQAYGDEHPRTRAFRNNLAGALYSAGRLDESERIYLETLESARRELGEDHVDTLAIMHNLAGVYFDRKQWDKAAPLYETALAGRTATLGPTHPSTLGTLNNISTMYRRQGEYDKALPLSERAAAAFTEVLGEDHPNRLIVMSNLAELYNKLERFEDAEAILSDVRTRISAAVPPTHWIIGLVEMRYAQALAGLGRVEEAEPIIRAGYEIIMSALGEDHPNAIDARKTMHEFYTRLGRDDEARQFSTPPVDG